MKQKIPEWREQEIKDVVPRFKYLNEIRVPDIRDHSVFLTHGYYRPDQLAFAGLLADQYGIERQDVYRLALINYLGDGLRSNVLRSCTMVPVWGEEAYSYAIHDLLHEAAAGVARACGVTECFLNQVALDYYWRWVWPDIVVPKSVARPPTEGQVWKRILKIMEAHDGRMTERELLTEFNASSHYAIFILAKILVEGSIERDYSNGPDGLRLTYEFKRKRPVVDRGKVEADLQQFLQQGIRKPKALDVKVAKIHSCSADTIAKIRRDLGLHPAYPGGPIVLAKEA